MPRSLCSLFALCFLAGCCFGQEPIVEIKVTPEKSVFKNSAWNKPIVIKSQDEAAKHFAKDALETITRKVDFKKQIVLVFAWQGSSGDRLEFKILESFPEQIPFSLRPRRYRRRPLAQPRLRPALQRALEREGAQVGPSLGGEALEARRPGPRVGRRTIC